MNHLPARLSVVVAALLVAASVVSPVVAQSKAVEISWRDVEITILPNGDVQVVETWEAQFVGGPFSSMSCVIESDRADGVTAWSVTEGERNYRAIDTKVDGGPYTFSYSRGKLTWYYPETYDQTRIFTLRYLLKSPLRATNGNDEFFWEFSETYPIGKVRAIMHLPGKFKTGDVWFLAVRDHTGEPIRSRLIDEQTIEFSDDFRSRQANWTIQARFPHGAVTVTSPAEPDVRNTVLAWVTGIILIIIMILLLVDGLNGFPVLRRILKVLGNFYGAPD